MVSLPNLTHEGYRILVYRLKNHDPSVLDFVEALKAFCMFNDARISEDGIVNGYVILFDMTGTRLGHLAKVKFGALKTYMQYIQVHSELG